MLSISEFAEMCHLSPQTLRYYHAEGLLVPSDVDETTGYRTYTIDQVERAMLVTVLRGTGLSVRDVRQALDHPDSTPTLLAEQTAAVMRRRRLEDEALSDAHVLVEAWPEVRRSRLRPTTVLSMVVPGPPAAPHAPESSSYDWDWVDTATAQTVESLADVARARGLRVVGRPWRTEAIETDEQKRAGLTMRGPHWLAKLPVGTDDAEDESVGHDLPEGIEVQQVAARDELTLFLPGRSTMAKLGTAVTRLLAHPLEDAYADLARMRYVIHEDGIETATAIIQVGDQEDLDP